MEKSTSEPPSRGSAAADIIRKGSVITFITLASRPLGYIREAIQAYLFGATLLVDAFVVAFNFPELVQTLFFAGATSTFLVPVCTKYLGDRDEFARIYSTFMTIAFVVTAAASLLFLIFSSIIVDLIGPGFDAETKAVTRTLFIIMIPVILLHTLLSVQKAFLNAREHFAAPELSGILWNFAFITAALFLSRSLGIYSLAIGVTAGAFLQVLMQVPYLRRLGIRYQRGFSLGHPAVREAKTLFLGALVATSVVPINSFVGRVIGSYLPHGEVASLAYAFRIFILPASLFAVPIYTVAFTRISKLYHDRDFKGLFSHVDSSIVLLCITLIPSTIVICGIGDVLVRILYERGAFTARETAMTTRALFGYGAGLLFYALSISLVRIFNALHDVKTPAVVGITSIALNALCAWFLMKPLGNLGIALATSLTSLYNFAVLYALLKRRVHYAMTKKSMRDVIRSLLAGVILAAAIWATRLSLGAHPYILGATALVLTPLVYGLFFRSYYMGLLKRRV